MASRNFRGVLLSTVKEVWWDFHHCLSSCTIFVDTFCVSCFGSRYMLASYGEVFLNFNRVEEKSKYARSISKALFISYFTI